MNEFNVVKIPDYHVGNSVTLSELFFFKTFPHPGEKWSPHIALYGDMGNVNARY